jgi:peptidoglycan hydrolase CwlO-like protein
MTKALDAAYAKDPSDSTREITKILDKLDLLDERVYGLERSRDDLLETAGKLDTRKLKKLEKEIEATRKEITETLDKVDRLSRYDLKPPSKV